MAKKSFVIGKEPFPVWFKELAAKGRAKLVYNDDEQLQEIRIVTPTKNYIGVPGDAVVFSKSGMTVVKGEKKNVKE